MRALAELCDKVGLVPTIIGVFGWLLCGAVVVPAIGGVLWPYPTLAYAIAYGVIGVVGIGGLFGFWIVAAQIEDWRRGYRVRWLGANDWIYEERSDRTGERCFPYIREVLPGPGYPVPCAIRLLSQSAWETEAPLWARGRRSEIAKRIAECHGADIGGKVQFLE